MNETALEIFALFGIITCIYGGLELGNYLWVEFVAYRKNKERKDV